jgi:hypothetical protein
MRDGPPKVQDIALSCRGVVKQHSLEDKAPFLVLLRLLIGHELLISIAANIRKHAGQLERGRRERRRERGAHD